ncbi:MFS transporter [Bacillus sp. AFS088145]|uniref:MFS transporter n=1 Tax=Bacillus sp. AFS088145 TaxID=2033514 RepID=UPI000BF9DD91|nr:MFS transporter [Bacillus sp. AFS088145]PFH86930.1 MFS transporter [Bacillus sp. AFS088145]
MTSTKVIKPFSSNWYVLLSFAVLAGISQMLWLNFAPLISYLKSHYEVSESDINWLLIVFPLIYIVFSIHSGKVIDRAGYRFSILLGGIFMSVFSTIRIFDSSFSFLLIGQVGIAIGQPYILNAISSLVVDWFPKNKQATATGIGTVGMFIGMAVALAGTPLLVAFFGFQPTLVIMAILTILATLVFYFIGHHNSDFNRNSSTSGSFSTTFKLLKNKNLLLLNIVSFLGLGVFNGLTSWLEQILKPYGISSEQAGIIGGTLIVGGIIGSIVIPMVSDKAGKRKPFLLITIIGSLLLIYPVCTSGNFTFLIVIASVLGFIFLPAFALLLSATEELVGEKVSGEATGLLLMAGNLGAVIVIGAMQLIKGEQSTWNHSVFFILILMLIGFFLMISFEERACLVVDNKENDNELK